MRTFLLLSAMLLAPAAQCLAQSHDGATAAATADGAQPSPAQVATRAAGPKSAFGRVMAVLIAKLVQDRTREARETETTDNDATTLPIDIDVGAAFQADAVVATKESAIAPAAPVAVADDSHASDATAQTSEPIALQAALPADGP